MGSIYESGTTRNLSEHDIQAFQEHLNNWAIVLSAKRLGRYDDDGIFKTDSGHSLDEIFDDEYTPNKDIFNQIAIEHNYLALAIFRIIQEENLDEISEDLPPQYPAFSAKSERQKEKAVCAKHARGAGIGKYSSENQTPKINNFKC